MKTRKLIAVGWRPPEELKRDLTLAQEGSPERPPMALCKGCDRVAMLRHGDTPSDPFICPRCRNETNQTQKRRPLMSAPRKDPLVPAFADTLHDLRSILAHEQAGFLSREEADALLETLVEMVRGRFLGGILEAFGGSGLSAGEIRGLLGALAEQRAEGPETLH